MKAFDEQQIRSFLPFVFADGHCVEIRAFGAVIRNGSVISAQRFTSTVGGFFDDVHSLLAVATHFDGVSPYVTVNPVKRDLIARIANRVKHLGKGEGTKDEDVSFIRWIPIDIDSVRPDGISATDEELGFAVELRDRILAENPEIAAASIWGKSGNGCWIWVRVDDLPNTPETYERVKRFIGGLAERYGDKGKPNGQKVVIDRKTCNAARVMAFPGTLKCKGENDKRRPWRMATLDTVGGTAPIPPIDLDRWEADRPQAAADHAKNTTSTAIVKFPTDSFVRSADYEDRSHRLRRAAGYVSKMPPAVSGHNGHDRTFAVASALINGFDLTQSEARPILDAYNQTCIPEWEPSDLARKLDQAESTPHAKPPGHLYDAPNPNGDGLGNGEGRRLMGALLGMSDASTISVLPDLSESCPPGQEGNPHRLARLFLGQSHSHADGPTLRFWRDEFFAWNGRAYSPVPNKEVRAAVSTVVSVEFQRLYITALMRFRMKQELQKQAVNSAQTSGQPGGGGDKEPKLLPVTTALVSDVVQALSGTVLVPVAEFPAQPAWLDEENDWSPTEILPTTTALVHLPTLAQGGSCMRSPTPRFFSTWSCDYAFDGSAPSPIEWLRFLATVWPTDASSVEMLQEWFGYCLTLDTRQQKMMMLIGPKRSGKGTIANILSALLGPDNVSGPTLSGLAAGFGLAPLIGKPLAIVDDARLSGRADQAVIAERLLTISGEGTITIERKYLDAWTGKLPTRIMLLSNELPKLADSSGALPGRLLILRLTRSFFGNEDKALLGRLLAELPGVLLWAIEGWKRLQRRGGFSEPSSASTLKNAMGELSSPVAEFIAEQCVVAPDAKIPRSILFNAWKSWNQAMGTENVGDERSFGRKLHSMCHELGDARAQHEGVRVRLYAGIRLKTALELETEAFAEPAYEAHEDPILVANVPVF